MSIITSREAIAELISKSQGKVFTVEFTKANGELRKMNARLGVTGKLKGGKSTIAHKENLIGCYDMQTGGYRCINRDTIKSAKVGGEEYVVQEGV